MHNTTAIPSETALRLCQGVREGNRGRWYTVDGLWCWGCSTFSGSPEKRCFASRPDLRGCRQVNARYDALPKTDFVIVDEPVAETPSEAEITLESSPVIYLPPAGFSARQRRRTCAGCGRQFRIAASQQESDYCPTCDYRRLRGQLIEQAGEDVDED